MPYHIQFDSQLNGVVTTYSGDVTDDDLMKAHHEIIGEGSEFLDLRYSVSDFSDITKYHISSACIREQAYAAKEFAEIHPDHAVIVIASGDLEYGSARMWAAFSDETGWDVKIFRSRSEGFDWIKTNL